MEQQDKIETTEVSMIEPEVVMQIRTLSGLGWGTRRIANEVGASRKAVKRYLLGAAAAEQVRPKGRCLDVNGEALARQLFTEVAEGNAVVVRDILVERGYDVSERTVQRVVSSIRREQRAADVATARFETAPGGQMQIDFGEKRVRIGGNVVVVHLMAAVLGYSRRIFVKAFLAERAEDWREGIASAFRHFGGVTKTLLVDNTRCLVIGRNVDTRELILHAGLVELCKNFDCAVRACAPYRARTKGKIENGVKYVKRNALAGREFASFAELEAHLSSWMARVDGRVHGTTNEVPNVRFEVERTALKPLPSSSIRVRARRLARQVANDAFVNVDTVRYSVPHTLVGARVEVDVGEERVRIYVGDKVVAEHARSREPHSIVVERDHHAALWRLPSQTAAATATATNATAKATTPPSPWDRGLDAYARAIESETGHVPPGGSADSSSIPRRIDDELRGHAESQEAGGAP
jgi:transposase